jgi:hypothetical protein
MKEWYNKYKLLFPLIILSCFSIWTYVAHLTEGVVLSQYHNLAFAACGLCLFSFFAVPKFYKQLLGITLILGLFNFLNFTPSVQAYHISISNLGISFQPLSLAVGVFTLLLVIRKQGELATIRKGSSASTPQQQYAESVEKFRNKFADRTDAELQELIADKRFTPAAKEAAQQLLNERQVLPEE